MGDTLPGVYCPPIPLLKGIQKLQIIKKKAYMRVGGGGVWGSGGDTLPWGRFPPPTLLTMFIGTR